MEYCRCGEQASFSIKGEGLCPGCVRQEAEKAALARFIEINAMEQKQKGVEEMQKDIRFLKELQEELKTQETDGQAAPRFWVIIDFQTAVCLDGYHDEYHVASVKREYSDEVYALLEDIEADELDNLSEEAKESFNDIGCAIPVIGWLQEYWSDDAELIPVKLEEFICPNTMFITKREAEEHIKANHYHYSAKAHTYAMTAWRAPKVERLLKVLEKFDWDSVNKNN